MSVPPVLPLLQNTMPIPNQACGSDDARHEVLSRSEELGQVSGIVFQQPLKSQSRKVSIKMAYTVFTLNFGPSIFRAKP